MPTDETELDRLDMVSQSRTFPKYHTVNDIRSIISV